MLKERFVLFILSLLSVLTVSAQRSVLRGTVTDSITGESLPFASLVWQGTTVGAKTDMDGHYSLSSPVVRRVLEALCLTGVARDVGRC